VIAPTTGARLRTVAGEDQEPAAPSESVTVIVAEYVSSASSSA
jgi:hypothetical protein